MSRFDFKELQVTADRTTRLKMHEISFAPTLILGPATEENKPYFNAVLRKSRRTAQALKAGKMTAEMLDESRGDDRLLFPIHVIKGWEDMKDAKGKDVKFDKEAAADFVKALPNWLFDNVRNHAGNQINFVQDDQDDPMDGEARAGNSQPGSSGS